MASLRTYYEPLLAGAGFTDGEAVERAWASLSTRSIQVREMNPGRRTVRFSPASILTQLKGYLVPLKTVIYISSQYVVSLNLIPALLCTLFSCLK
jgi:hypothetical protein